MMELMPIRRFYVDCAIKGFQETGQALVFKCHDQLTPLTSDDKGMYYFVIKLYALLGGDPQILTDYFLYGLMIASILIGLPAAIMAVNGWLQRVVTLIGFTLLLFVMLLSHKDVYVAASAACVVVVPWAVLFIRKASARGHRDWIWLAFHFLAGATIITANFMRSYSGAAVLILLVFLVVFQRKARLFWKGVALVTLGLGMLAANLVYDSAIEQRDAFLRKEIQNYKPPISGHPFWSNAFIGLGYISNDFGLAYQDNVADSKLAEIAPGVSNFTPESERILRNEYFRMIREHPVYFLSLISAKIGVILMYVLVFANIGLFIPRRYRPPAHFEFAFLTAMAFSALPGLIAIPSLNYLTGLMALSALYGIFNLCHGLDAGLWSRSFSEVRARRD